MKWVFLFAASAFLLLKMGTNEIHGAYYCQQCGIRCTRDRYEWCGIPYWKRVQFQETNYYKLHRKLVAASCKHQWKFQHGSSSGDLLLLQGRENACGRLHQVLRHDQLLHPLTRFRDRSKVTGILTSLDLKRDPSLEQASLEHFGAVLEAFEELKNISTLAQEERWWQKHYKLFTKPQRRTQSPNKN